MVQNLREKTAYELIVNDFKSTWTALVEKEKCQTHQGPVFFGFLAMHLLEFVCRLCKNNEQALIEFSRCLYELERKYFIQLPNLSSGHKKSKKRKNKPFSLPHLDGQDSDGLLLTLLFNLVRNGIAHLYQPIVINLKDDKKFYIVLGSASREIDVKENSNHLCYDIDQNGDIRMLVYPEYVLRHVELAVMQSKALDRRLKVNHFDEPLCDVSVQQLDEALRGGGACRCFMRVAKITYP